MTTRNDRDWGADDWGHPAQMYRAQGEVYDRAARTRDLLSWSNGQGAQEEPVTGPCEANAHDEIDLDGVCERCGFYPGDPGLPADVDLTPRDPATALLVRAAAEPEAITRQARHIPIADAILVATLLDLARHVDLCLDLSCPEVRLVNLYDDCLVLGRDDKADDVGMLDQARIAASIDHDDPTEYRDDLRYLAAAWVLGI